MLEKSTRQILIQGGKSQSAKAAVISIQSVQITALAFDVKDFIGNGMLCFFFHFQPLFLFFKDRHVSHQPVLQQHRQKELQKPSRIVKDSGYENTCNTCLYLSLELRMGPFVKCSAMELELKEWPKAK